MGDKSDLLIATHTSKCSSQLSSWIKATLLNWMRSVAPNFLEMLSIGLAAKFKVIRVLVWVFQVCTLRVSKTSRWAMATSIILLPYLIPNPES